jgi:chromosome segregation ATPase
MDNEGILKKIEQLEEQTVSLKKAVSAQNKLVNDANSKVEKFLEIVRDQSSEITRLNNQIGSLTPIDAALSKLRIDMNKLIAESEKRVLLEAKMQDNLRDQEMQSIGQNIEKMKKDLEEEINRKIKVFLDENSRIVQRNKEIETRVDEKISNTEDQKGYLDLLQQEVRQNKKIVDSHANDLDFLKTRQEDLRQKMDNLMDDVRGDENRVNEIVASEAERRSAFVAFVEQQNILKKDQEKTWGNWQTQFDSTIKSINVLIPELQNQQFELNKTKAAFDEISSKFERRANELTEMYRLMDQKFRKEWDTYIADAEKRWANFTLTFDDRQGSYTEQFEKVRERMLAVEDRTSDMQEALLIMSREIQKGMHSLMNMVNNWMDAFSIIKPEK